MMTFVIVFVHGVAKRGAARITSTIICSVVCLSCKCCVADVLVGIDRHVCISACSQLWPLSRRDVGASMRYRVLIVLRDV